MTFYADYEYAQRKKEGREGGREARRATFENCLVHFRLQPHESPSGFTVKFPLVIM